MGLRGALLRGVRVLSLGIAAGAALVLVLIVAQVAQHSPLKLHRFREPTWVLYGGLALFALARPQPRAFLSGVAERAAKIFDSGRFFPALATTALALFFVVSATSHLSFHTLSHDFGIFDEALEWTLRGQLLFSPIQGHGFLAEHFSPLLLVLVPLHALWRSPWLLVAVHPLLLWAAVFPLRSLLEGSVSRRVTNLACLIYLAHPTLASALRYGFHVEAFLPLILFALLRVARRGPALAHGALLVGALSIKEDVGLYLLGFAAWLAVAERRIRLAVITAAAALAWVSFAVFVVAPRLPGGTAQYRFLSRWSDWGQSPGEILATMASRPDLVVLALLAPPFLVFYCRLV